VCPGAVTAVCAEGGERGSARAAAQPAANEGVPPATQEGGAPPNTAL
jgi:hypothetical protein